MRCFRQSLYADILHGLVDLETIAQKDSEGTSAIFDAVSATKGDVHGAGSVATLAQGPDLANLGEHAQRSGGAQGIESQLLSLARMP